MDNYLGIHIYPIQNYSIAQLDILDIDESFLVYLLNFGKLIMHFNWAVDGQWVLNIIIQAFSNES